MRNKQKGFSLIELLIVVAIILIIAAIAIPNLLRSKMAANEASAVGSLRTLNTACVSYSTSYGGYPDTLAKLGPAAELHRDVEGVEVEVGDHPPVHRAWLSAGVGRLRRAAAGGGGAGPRTTAP